MTKLNSTSFKLEKWQRQRVTSPTQSYVKKGHLKFADWNQHAVVNVSNIEASIRNRVRQALQQQREDWLARALFGTFLPSLFGFFMPQL